MITTWLQKQNAIRLYPKRQILESEDEQSLKPFLRQPWIWVWATSFFSLSIYENGWPVLFLAISSSTDRSYSVWLV